ncbi:MAG: calcium/sodium antiporter [Spirochaetes bacterium]|nr:calcium/sodium antiporter [Spirochaetota bacterium]
MIYNIFLLILSIVMLWLGSDKLVGSSHRIARQLGISELVIGLTVVALGTSAPEFAVTITAALKGMSSISVGNIVGSNIFNLGFILGTVALFRSIKISRKLIYRDGILMIASTLLLLIFFLDLKLNLLEGLILTGILIIYLIFLFIKKEPLEEDDEHNQPATWKDWILLPASIVVIVIGGKLLVSSGCYIARSFGISEWVIGVTIVAAGTSSPEMATSIVAAFKGRHGISAGNLIGSNIFNLLGVLGLTGIIHPLTIADTSFYSLIMLSGMVFLAVIIMRTRWLVSRIEGILLIASGLALWIYDFLK